MGGDYQIATLLMSTSENKRLLASERRKGVDNLPPKLNGWLSNILNRLPLVCTVSRFCDV